MRSLIEHFDYVHVVNVHDTQGMLKRVMTSMKYQVVSNV